MHNLHLVKIRAESCEDACRSVELEILDWGDEDNWRVICGCLREDGEVYSTGEGRYDPTGVTSASITSTVREWAKGNEFHKNGFIESARAYAKGESIDSMTWYRALNFCKYKFALGNLDPETLNPWKQTFRDWELDEPGVTHINLPDASEGDSSISEYLVFVDIHS